VVDQKLEVEVEEEGEEKKHEGRQDEKEGYIPQHASIPVLQKELSKTRWSSWPGWR